MKVNHNIQAVIANDNLMVNENNMAASIERLSSGLKINHAKDDPTGMAISITMKAQIDGLSQASDNSKNGQSVINTADGALGEITSILQRMRELAVQGSNATNTESDLDAIQAEMESMQEEIDRISGDTEYNTLNLLDGNLGRRVYATTEVTDTSTTPPTVKTCSVNNINITDCSSEVEDGDYYIEVTADATQATMTSTITSSTATTITVNGVSAEIDFSDSTLAMQQLQQLGEYAGVDITSSGGSTVTAGDTLTFTSKQYGDEIDLEVTGLTMTGYATYDAATGIYSSSGTDVQVTLESSGTNPNSDFLASATVTTNGQYITIQDRGGFSMEAVIGDLELDETSGETKEIDLNVTSIGMMNVLIGANEGQSIDIDIPEISNESLGLTYVNVCNFADAQRAISDIDDALAKVNDVRARLGAYENRLEHAQNNLDTEEENLTSAISRIQDVDMAEEMTTYTNLQILSQAGTSVLSQANDLPEEALQLLR